MWRTSGGLGRASGKKGAFKGSLMAKVDEEEVLHIAGISRLKIYDSEFESLSKHLRDVLNYAERVSEIASTGEEPSNRNVNVVREDVIVRKDPEKMLGQAPNGEEDYFVVPAILDN